MQTSLIPIDIIVFISAKPSYEQIYFNFLQQEWLQEVLLNKRTDIVTYAQKLSTSKSEPDGAIIVMLSALIDRAITLVPNKGIWCSNLDDNHDIVLGYFGHSDFKPTQVGKYLVLSTHQYLLSTNRRAM